MSTLTTLLSTLAIVSAAVKSQQVTRAQEKYDEYSFSRQQFSGYTDAINAYINGGLRWVILLAQMQSGKTETYLFICCELIRLDHVETAVIFSGNSETDLRDQLQKEVDGGRGTKFYAKYEAYLEDVVQLGRAERHRTLDKVQPAISIIWGAELNKYTKTHKNTLFVWEEAHHAQSINQCPDKFLKKIGVPANGDKDILAENGNFVISISATPFSELSDLHHLGQNKSVVYLEPGVGYNSVKDIKMSGRLKSFTNLEDGIRSALSEPHTSPKYAIIRITNKNEEVVLDAIRRSGWRYVVFDSLTSGAEQALGKSTWGGMKEAPKQDTVIVLRGKCRMGKNLDKQHVLCVMETAKSSKTDTVLQGLLGRACGYSEGSNQVVVYLHEKIVNSGEIERYIELTDNIQANGVQVIPTKARNLTEHRVKITNPIIPLKITRDLTRFPTNNSHDIKADLYDAFTNKNRIDNKNSGSVFDEVCNNFLAAHNSKRLKPHYLDTKRKTRNETVAYKIRDAFDNGSAERFGSGCGIDAAGLEINVWVPKFQAWIPTLCTLLLT